MAGQPIILHTHINTYISIHLNDSFPKNGESFKQLQTNALVYFIQVNFILLGISFGVGSWQSLWQP